MTMLRVATAALLLAAIACGTWAQQAPAPDQTPEQLAQAPQPIQVPRQLPFPRQPGIELPQQPGIQLPRLRIPLLRFPDLTVEISGPDRVAAGDEISLKITVTNEGRGPASGTNDAPATQSYMVDLVLSQDEEVPMGWATQPTYAGYTEDDFVEDMLLLGGRLSNTRTVAGGDSTTYTESVPIPANTEPGVYCLAAVVDPGNNVFEFDESDNIYYHRIRIAPAEEEEIQPPQNVTGLWVMPWGVGGTRLDRIKSSGLVDYAGITDAPFGWRLGLRHGYDNAIPNNTVKYYRWLYRKAGTAEWTELVEAVKVHYVKEEDGDVTFPAYTLGPKGIAGRNLYEFRPHNPPTEPGATTYWPDTDWFGDIYSGFFDTRTLPDGEYRLKLECYKADGTLARPGVDFQFIVPTGTTADGTITTALAPAGRVFGGGYVFALHVDNSHCGASIDPPRLGDGTLTGQCGFLLYDPGVAETQNAARCDISFHATHPSNFATFRFRVIRGSMEAESASGEVNATTASPFSGDGNGNFENSFTRSQLLGPDCPEKAAFSLNLHVRAKATNGWSRLQRYDAHDVRAFAIAPR